MTSAWPVTLTSPELILRPLRRRDANQWYALRRHNADWLRQWEATLPAADPSIPGTYRGMVRAYQREAKASRAQAFALEVGGRLMGQVTIGGIALGSLRSAYIGYWISQDAAGLGLMPKAVAMVTDHAFDSLRLHRLEINIRPENASSRRVAEKLGYREEGFRRNYLHIEGQWRDHNSYVMLADERPAMGLAAHVALHGWRDQKSDESDNAQHRVGSVGDTGESVPRMRGPRP